MAQAAELRQLVVAPFDAALGALERLIAAAKGADPLAPVTVVCPSRQAAVVLRRWFGARPGGVANVRFLTAGDLAELLGGPPLAAAGCRPLTSTLRRAVIRAELRRSPAPFGAAADHAATEHALHGVVSALEGLPADVLDRVAATGPAASEAVRLHRAVKRHLPHHYTVADALAAAATAVRAEPARAAEGGPVVLYLPERLSPAEADLVHALAGAVGAAAVVGRADASEGDGAGDAGVGALVEALTPLLGPPCLLPGAGGAPTAGTILLSAPDPEEEVRGAVRTVLARAEHGVPFHRTAILWRLPEPYALLVHEQLAAAGVPAHGPATGRISQTVAGRTLLGALALADDGLRRSEVAAWLTAGPILDDDGAVVPATRWDHLSRRAGVVAGADQWRDRLGALARSLAAERRRTTPDDEAAHARLEAEIAEINRLREFVAGLAGAVRPPASEDWRSMAAWGRALLDRYLGNDSAPPGWPAVEIGARQAVLDALDRLAALDDVTTCSGPGEFRAALEHELDVPVGTTAAVGGGVFTGRLDDAVGAPFDTVVVVGMTEGGFPPPPTGDPVLDDAARAATGGILPQRAQHRDHERRSYVGVVAGAAHRLLCHPRSDPRGQRRSLPSRWFVEAAGALAGRRVAGDGVDVLAGEPWYRFEPSFDAATRAADVAVTPAELDLQALLRYPPPDAPALHPVLAADAVLAKGVEARRARHAMAADAWSGFVGPLPGLAPPARPRSATSLETWARCPFRYFLGQVLHVGDTDDPEAPDAISPLDRGSLIHEILERFIGTSLGRAAGQPWDEEDAARLHAIATEVLGRYEAEGRTGRALLWRAEERRIRRDLDRFLAADSEWRRAAGVVPTEVEWRFGFEGEGDPVTLGLAGGVELAFRGLVDRLDVSADGTRVVVLDYKTGSTTDYAELVKGGPGGDLVCRGQHLQLPVYALAAAAAHPGAEIAAYFWFVTATGRFARAGGPVDAAARARFEHVMDVVVTGITSGAFGARPGKRNEFFNSFEQCRHCPYDRVCPGDRHLRWERHRRHSALGPYLELIGEDVDAEEAAR